MTTVRFGPSVATMQNLDAKQVILGRVAATLDDTSTHNCALMRATGDKGRGSCIGTAVAQFGITYCEACAVVSGWDGLPNNNPAGDDYYTLGQQARALVEGARVK